MWKVWRGLRLRTKVLAVVVFLIVVGALAPDEEEKVVAAGGRQPSEQLERESRPAESGGTSNDVVAGDNDDEISDPGPTDAAATVPALRSQSIQEARRMLRQAGLTAEVVRQASWQPAGTVLKQGDRPGTSLVPGGPVTLVVAAPMPRVPGVVGQGADIGRTALARAGFKVAIVVDEVSTGQDGVVLSQSPPGAEQAAPGSVVRLVISKVVRPVAPLANTNCTTGYRPCLPPASDYDCAGGSGDGPKYASGPIYVTGSDPYDLDSEGDGIACEA